MMIFIYCPKCGYYERIDYDNTDVRLDVEMHCGKCNALMITHCPNPDCPIYLIEKLDNNFCKCGTEYPDISKTRIKPKSYQFPTRECG